MAFSKAFKREMGVAPGQYRRSLSQSSRRRLADQPLAQL